MVRTSSPAVCNSFSCIFLVFCCCLFARTVTLGRDQLFPVRLVSYGERL